MLIAAAIWLTLLFLVLAFCRAAASADDEGLAHGSRYPSRSAGPLRVGVGARAVADRVPPHGEAGVATGGASGERRALGI